MAMEKSKKILLLNERVSHYKQYLDATKSIENYLEAIDEDTALDNITKKMDIRNSLMKKIDKINKDYLSAGEINPAEKEEYDKLLWLKDATLKEIVELDKINGGKMAEIHKIFAKNVKDTKDSIKVLNAYSNSIFTD